MRRQLVLLLAATVLTALAVGGVLALREPEPEPDDASAAPRTTPESSPAPTPGPSLAEVDTTALVVARAGFCDAVPAEAVTEALGGEPTSANAYANGERARLADDVDDVAHEFGCVWSGPGTEVRAWVFAPPVSPADARALRRAADRQEGCRTRPDAARFGEPTTASVCRSPEGPVASYRGLFGDAWLACSVAGGGSREDAAARADRWCAAVALAAAD